LISSNNDASVIRAKKVSSDIRLDGLEKSIDIEDVFISVFGDDVDVVLTHGNNDLFPRGSFGGHVDSGLCLLVGVMCNVVHFNDFFFGQFRKP